MENKTITRWRVRFGIFSGHEFLGEEITINDEERIFDTETVGRSYLKINCEQIYNYDLQKQN